PFTRSLHDALPISHNHNNKIRTACRSSACCLFGKDVIMTKSQEIIEQTNHYGAPNYNPLPIVISEAEGLWVKDPEGNKYLDMLSAYSVVNQGHRHPKIIQA